MIEKYRQRVIEHIWLFLVLLFICIAGIIGFMSKVKIITGDNLISTNIINAAGKFILSFFVLSIWNFDVSSIFPLSDSKINSFSGRIFIFFVCILI